MISPLLEIHSELAAKLLDPDQIITAGGGFRVYLEGISLAVLR
jgi:hypothetical protein